MTVVQQLVRSTPMRRSWRARAVRTGRSVRRWSGRVVAARAPLLDAAGLGLLSWAAGMLAAPAGVAAAGLACLVMSWRLSH